MCFFAFGRGEKVGKDYANEVAAQALQVVCSSYPQNPKTPYLSKFFEKILLKFIFVNLF